MQKCLKVGAVTALVAGLCGVAPQIVQADAASTAPVVVVSGLNNPRQLTLVGNDELLIAEAGKGGSVKSTGPDGDVTYIGNSGSISAVYLPQYARHTTPTRIVKGLMSGAGADGSAAVGSDGVAARSPHGPIYIQETYAPPAALPRSLRGQNGRTLWARPYGRLHAFANISYFESTHDPDHHGFDSDPYAIVARKTDFLVADAAGNDVLRVDAAGHVHLWHVFPNVRTGSCAQQADPTPKFPGCNFVPTTITTDATGHVYVGGLSSLMPRQAQVVKLSADGKKVLRTWHGFTGVSGLAASRSGVLYVSELFAPEAHPANPQIQGRLTRISTKGVRAHRDVPFPAGLALNSKGVLFVSAFSIAPATGLGAPGTSGQVWRMKW